MGSRGAGKVILMQFWVDFGKLLGSILTSKTGPKRGKQNFSMKLRFLRDFGRVLGGFGEGFGRVLGGFGSFLAALGASQGCFNCFVVSLVCLGLFCRFWVKFGLFLPGFVELC